MQSQKSADARDAGPRRLEAQGLGCLNYRRCRPPRASRAWASTWVPAARNPPPHPPPSPMASSDGASWARASPNKLPRPFKAHAVPRGSMLGRLSDPLPDRCSSAAPTSPTRCCRPSPTPRTRPPSVSPPAASSPPPSGARSAASRRPTAPTVRCLLADRPSRSVSASLALCLTLLCWRGWQRRCSRTH